MSLSNTVTGQTNRSPEATLEQVVSLPSGQERPARSQLPGSRSGLATSVSYLASDTAAIGLAMTVSWTCWALVSGRTMTSVAMEEFALAIFGLTLQVLVLGASGLYSALDIGPVASLARIVKSLTWTTALFGICVALAGHATREWVALVLVTGLLCVVLVPFGRTLTRSLLGKSDLWGRRVFIVGSNPRAVAVYTRLMRHPQRGLRPVGFVDDLETLDPNLDPALYLGPPEALRELALTLGVNAAVVVTPDPNDAETQRLFCREELGIRDWILLPTLDGYPSLWGSSLEIGGVAAIRARNRLLLPMSRLLKRAMDVALTLAATLLAWPLLVGIMVLIRLSSAGPIFYCHERIGRHGRRFQAWKFRTMVVNADQVLEEYLAKDPVLRAEWDASHKLKCDPRITWIGHFLRKTSFDELPQLWNVLRGEMSLVGPRPIVEAEIDRYADQYEYYVDVFPGITGMWQVSGRNNTTYEERIALDAYYVKNWSLWLDLYILVSTIRVILFREGAY